MSKKPLRSTGGLSTLDGALAEDGTLEAFQAVAIKEVLAWQIQEAMRAEPLPQEACRTNGNEPEPDKPLA